MEVKRKTENAIEDSALKSAEWAQAYAMLRLATEMQTLALAVKDSLAASRELSAAISAMTEAKNE